MKETQQHEVATGLVCLAVWTQDREDNQVQGEPGNQVHPEPRPVEAIKAETSGIWAKYTIICSVQEPLLGPSPAIQLGFNSLSVCMCVCVCVWAVRGYVTVHANMHPGGCGPMHAGVHAVCLRVHACMCVHAYVSGCVCACAGVCVCVCGLGGNIGVFVKISARTWAVIATNYIRDESPEWKKFSTPADIQA